jgi:adenylate cyclase class 2
MIEVEIRSRIKDAEEIKVRLEQIGAKLTKSMRQIDKIFGHPMFLDSDKMVIEGGVIARIRKKDDDVALEFKEISRKSGGVEVSAKLSDIEAGQKLLDKLKYEEAFTIDKTRDQFSYKDFTICLDEVDKLGRFIEIEKMLSSADDHEEARKECLALLDSIAPDSELIDRKYGDLMQDILNKEKE